MKCFSKGKTKNKNEKKRKKNFLKHQQKMQHFVSTFNGKLAQATTTAAVISTTICSLFWQDFQKIFLLIFFYTELEKFKKIIKKKKLCN